MLCAISNPKTLKGREKSTHLSRLAFHFISTANPAAAGAADWNSSKNEKIQWNFFMIKLNRRSSQQNGLRRMNHSHIILTCMKLVDSKLWLHQEKKLKLKLSCSKRGNETKGKQLKLKLCGTMYVQPYVQPTGPYRLSTAPYNTSSLDYRFIVACVWHNS